MHLFNLEGSRSGPVSPWCTCKHVQCWPGADVHVATEGTIQVVAM